IERRWLKARLAHVLSTATHNEYSYPDPDDIDRTPWVYPTLNEALLGFLIYRVSNTRRFPYTFENWLKTAFLVLADVQHQPDLLKIRATTYERSGPALDTRESVRTMAVTDDWDCLSRDAFEHVLNRFLITDVAVASPTTERAS